MKGRKTQMNKTVYIYTLNDPKTGEVRYVGITKTPKKRLNDHISKSKKEHNPRASWIKSLLNNGLKPVMAIIDYADSENWQQCEMRWIAHYRAIGCDLVNSTDGGEGAYGISPSKETRRKMSEALKGKKHSESHRKKLSESQQGRKHTEETRYKLSKIMGGRNVPNRYIAILQYDKFGNLIKRWDSITQIEMEFGISNSSISKCCRYKRKSAGGYIWRYADDPIPQTDQPRLFQDEDK